MTADQKETLLHFITRTSMYIAAPVNKDTIVSFIFGFEIGSKNNFEFATKVQEYLEKKKIPYRSTGWPGQIYRFAEKKNISWVTAFKQVGLEVLAAEQNGGLTPEMQEMLKSRVVALIDLIGSRYWFKLSWLEEWNALCRTESRWFKQMWSRQQLSALKQISAEMNSDAFDKTEPFTPTPTLLALKEGFA